MRVRPCGGLDWLPSFSALSRGCRAKSRISLARAWVWLSQATPSRPSHAPSSQRVRLSLPWKWYPPKLKLNEERKPAIKGRLLLVLGERERAPAISDWGPPPPATSLLLPQLFEATTTAGGAQCNLPRVEFLGKYAMALDLSPRAASNR